MSLTLRIALAVSLCALLLCATACASCAANSTTTGSVNEPVSLSEKDNGSRITLGVGQELGVVLDSNPSTGYQWAIDTTPSICLSQVGEPTYVPASGSSGVVGAGGKETWAFEGASPGSTTLRLKYWRSFEPSATPASTFEVTVQVR